MPANDNNKKDLTAYRGHIINPLSPAKYEEHADGLMLVDEQGIIRYCGESKTFRESEFTWQKEHNFGKRIIMPGFVDLHVHLAQMGQAGRFGDTLLGWLNKYIFPAEAKFAREEYAVKLSNWFFKELFRQGTTLSGIFTSIHKQATDIAFEVAATCGARIIMGKVMMDRNAPESLLEQTKLSLQESLELCQQWHGYDSGRLQYAFTPRFAPTSTMELMTETGKLWKSFPGTFLQTHLSENADEIAWVKSLFVGSKNYLDVYGRCGLTGKRSLFAHAIHLTSEEIEELKDSESSVVFCPSSNMFLKSGIFPLRRITDKQIRFGLGSDVAAGPELSMMKVMKDAAYIQQDIWLPPAHLLYLATLGGAHAARMEDITGSLTAGKEADFIVINPALKSFVPYDILDMHTDEILASVIYQGDDRMVEKTYVRGKEVYSRDKNGDT